MRFNSFQTFFFHIILNCFQCSACPYTASITVYNFSPWIPEPVLAKDISVLSFYHPMLLFLCPHRFCFTVFNHFSNLMDQAHLRVYYLSKHGYFSKYLWRNLGPFSSERAARSLLDGLPHLRDHFSAQALACGACQRVCGQPCWSRPHLADLTSHWHCSLALACSHPHGPTWPQWPFRGYWVLRVCAGWVRIIEL